MDADQHKFSGFDTDRSAATNMVIDHQVNLDPSKDAFDHKLVSALLETTNESELSLCGHPAKVDAEQVSSIRPQHGARS